MKLKDEDKYNRLIKAAIDLLAEAGLANFSTTKVAKRAGIPQSNVYIYFENKQALLAAVFQVTVHEQSLAVVKGIDDEAPMTRQLVASIQTLYRFARAQPATVAALQVLLDDVQLKHQLHVKVDDEANQRIQAMLRAGREQQVLRTTDVNFLRYFLSRPVFHYAAGVQQQLYPDTPDALADLTKMIMGAVLQPAVYQTWLINLA
ncbi:TetR/AcrR family transcriptional regulator [Levilactobacillus enshiensis]|uniref:TetR/AcrR family transcriptional regulator n=1 Tax=Levilactobacillus enshiensis TaxID=2590213 RepID=UPI00117BA459|nr:TetR/AcrR family transcriptional regulator [Levilactobacillus enshiensis]